MMEESLWRKSEIEIDCHRGCGGRRHHQACIVRAFGIAGSFDEMVRRADPERERVLFLAEQGKPSSIVQVLER